nr:MAG TPA: hypothetical protein [Bacteriophage sp.]
MMCRINTSLKYWTMCEDEHNQFAKLVMFF